MSIEGPIAVGKSTCLEHITMKGLHHLRILTEPIDVWESYYDGTNMLRSYYENPYCYAFSFQLLVSISMAERQLRVEGQGHTIILMERSLPTSQIFAEIQEETGKLAPYELALLQDLYTQQTNLKPELIPDAMIYIQASADSSLAKVRRRGKPEEQDIGQSYLERIVDKHDEFILQGGFGGPVLVIDGNQETMELEAECTKILDWIMENHWEWWAKN